MWIFYKIVIDNIESIFILLNIEWVLKKMKFWIIGGCQLCRCMAHKNKFYEAKSYQYPYWKNVIKFTKMSILGQNSKNNSNLFIFVYFLNIRLNNHHLYFRVGQIFNLSNWTMGTTVYYGITQTKEKKYL